MAQPNFAYEKRQRELAKKRKKEEKLKRKAQSGPGGEEGQVEGAEGATPDASTPAGDTPAT
ncbi:MAG: hypothetical protein U1F52_13750 [Burkholderiales bacterium]